MRIAALYDIHGNLPALEAVLDEVEGERVDLVVFGGDVALGPMPVETLHRVASLGGRARFVMGNTDRDVVAAFDSLPGSGEGDEEAITPIRWVSSRIDQGDRDFMDGFDPTLAIKGEVGSMLFCHGSPRSDTEIITAVSPDERIGTMIADVSQYMVVCGHTHRQFDRRLGDKRIVNAGSVGLPYEGQRAAFWLLVDGEVELRRTDYHVHSALLEFERTGLPGVEEFFQESLIRPADPDEVARSFEEQAARTGP